MFHNSPTERRNFPCYCSQCFPGRFFIRIRTVKEHLDRDQEALKIRQRERRPGFELSEAALRRHIELNTKVLLAERQGTDALQVVQAEISQLLALPGVLEPHLCQDTNGNSSFNGNKNHTPEITEPIDQLKASQVFEDAPNTPSNLQSEIGIDGDHSMDLEDIAPKQVDSGRHKAVDEDPSSEEEDSDVDEEEHIEFLELQLEREVVEDSDEGESEERDTDRDPELECINSNSESNNDHITGFLSRTAVHGSQTGIASPSSNIPEELATLHSSLLNGYTCPPVPQCDKISPRLDDLSLSETYSLKHYIAWKKSGGTVQAYTLHSQVLHSITKVKILTLHAVRKLARDLVEFKPRIVDMCPRSCIAYTGKYKDLEFCPQMLTQEKKTCNLPRYQILPSGKKKPRAYIQVLPVKARIQALFANEETSKQLRYRDRCYQEALRVIKSGLSESRKFSDYADSEVHSIQCTELGLFPEPRDIALAISTDGAQLTMKKHSNTWLLILIILNLPPDVRYKVSNIIISLATPGPNSPADIESFLHPLFEELAEGSEGYWMWDAIDSSYFVNRLYAVMGLGDMLGSAKINGMAGHCAVHGDRFSMVQGAKSSLIKGAKAQYYPISPPDNEKYSPQQPSSYDLLNLPIRSSDEYYDTLKCLASASSITAKAKITKATGISKLPLCAASPAFIHPTFFPIDPFHLFYENNMAFIWDLWTSLTPSSDIVHLAPAKSEQFGVLVVKAMQTLPPVFCGPVRDPHLKRQSQYKVYEWMALLHWYILPIGIELGFNSMVLSNFANLVGIIEFSMTPIPRSEPELVQLRVLIKRFLEGFERLYMQGNPENISRMRLCVFQLIHIPLHIKWNGSVRLSSQATVERSIGEMGRKIRSKKSPYANLANEIFERELLKLMTLYFPSLEETPSVPLSGIEKSLKTTQQHRLSKNALRGQELALNSQALSTYFAAQNIDIWQTDLELTRWGKIRLSNGHVLRSRLSDLRLVTSREYRWFEAEDMSILDPIERWKPKNIIFGEVSAIYVLKTNTTPEVILDTVAVYAPLIKTKVVLNCIHGKWAPDSGIKVISCKDIADLVGIWKAPDKEKVYILRKHPGLAMLSSEERGSDHTEDESGGGPLEDETYVLDQ